MQKFQLPLLSFCALLVIALLPSQLRAQERLCDTAFEDCRTPLWTLIDQENVAIEYERADGELAALRFGDLHARSNRLARALASRGLQAGDRVGVYLSNRVEFVDDLPIRLSAESEANLSRTTSLAVLLPEAFRAHAAP